MKNCKFCHSTNLVKNGIVRESQRHLCKDCGKVQIEGDRRCNHCNEAKRLAVILYLEGNGFRRIARILNQIFKNKARYQAKKPNSQLLRWMSFTLTSKKPRKNKETGIQIGDYTRIWTAVDRKSGGLFEFEVGMDLNFI